MNKTVEEFILSLPLYLFISNQIIPMVSPAPLLALWAIIATIFAFLVSAVAVDLSKAIYWYRSRYLWMTVNIVSILSNTMN